MTRKLVFSVTVKDCEWSYTRGTGNGGQKKNKTNSAVHCMHRVSGAHGFAQDHREQRRNRELAFARMCQDPKFKMWQKLEFSRRVGTEAAIEETVSREMKKIRVDVKQNGRWVDEKGLMINPDPHGADCNCGSLMCGPNGNW